MTAAAQCFVFFPFFSILTPHYPTTPPKKKNPLLTSDFPVSNLKLGVTSLFTQFIQQIFSRQPKIEGFFTQKVDVLLTWNYSVFQTSGLLATVNGRFHLHDRITEFFQRQDFSIFFFNSVSLSNDLRYCLVLFYRPCGLSSHSSFHYFFSLLLLMRTLTCQSARNIFGCFFFCKRGSSPSLPQLDQMKVQNRLVRLLLVNSYRRTSVILVTAVCHCRRHEVQDKCGSQMSMHKCYQNKSVFIVLCVQWLKWFRFLEWASVV